MCGDKHSHPAGLKECSTIKSLNRKIVSFH